MESYMPPENDGALDPNAPAPKYVTAEEIGNIVNSAVTSHLKRFTEKGLPDLLKPITDKLAAATAPPPADDEEKKSGKKQSPELLAMANQLEDLKKELQVRDERVKAAEKKAANDKAFSELRASLEGKVRPELLDLVAKNLFHVESRVEVDETGTSYFKALKAPYIGAEPEEQRLPLKAGVEDFLKSDSAKAFLPAPSPGASNSQLPKRGPTANPGIRDFSKPAASDADKAQRAREREQMALENLKRQ